MNFIINNILETSTDTGDGDLTLLGAVTDYLEFARVYKENQVFFYKIWHDTLNEWEEGTGYYNGTTFARVQARTSSNSNAKVNFSVGTKNLSASLSVEVNPADEPEPEIPLGTTAEYFRGDKTWQNLSTAVSAFGYLLASTAASTYQVILTAINFGSFIVGLTSKTTPINADSLLISDSADTGKAKKVSGTDFKAYLKNYFDTLYATALGYTAENVTNKSSSYTSSSTTTYANTKALVDGLGTKQDSLVSATNIKSVNGATLLGSGDRLVGSVIAGYVSITQNASTTLYYVMNIILSGVAAASRIGRQIPFQAGTFKNFYFRTNTSQHSSGSQVVSLFVDSAVTSISVTIAAGSAAGSFSDVTNSATITAGQYVCYEVINNSTQPGAAIQGISIGFFA